MVVRRTCSFCAGDIEPGTGQLFVKRDGSLFSFCSSSCRKQQLGLGRVGHRLRWTRAHELKRLAEQRRQPAGTGAPTSSTPPAAGGRSKEPAPAPSEPGARKKATKPKPADSAAEPTADHARAPSKKTRAKKAPTAPASP